MAALAEKELHELISKSYCIFGVARRQLCSCLIGFPPRRYAHTHCKQVHQFTFAQATSLMSLLFLTGMAAVHFAPETRGQELPE
jgi:hypothetical protein